MAEERCDLPAKVRKWLMTSGYALEMRVAREAESHQPVYVHQSRYYVDPGTEKIRETDVLAAWAQPREKYWAWSYAVIECKGKPSPWVLFDGDEGISDHVQNRWDWAVTTSSSLAVEEAVTVPNPSYFDMHKTLFKASRVSNGVAETALSTDAKPDRNGAWDAVQAAVSAAHGFLRDVQRGGTGSPEGEFVLACFPIVVTSGKLFRSYLAGSEIVVEEVERGEVLVRPTVATEQTRCLIVTESGLSQVLAEVAETCKAM